MKLVICDLETDSANPSNAEILEIYMAIVDDWRITDELLLRIRPRRWNDESRKSVEIHKITLEEALKGEDWKVAMEKIYNFLPEEPHYFVCHANRRAGIRGCFDHQILSSHFFQLHSDVYYYFLKILPPNLILSTHSIVKNHLKINLENYKLDTICKQIGIELKNYHAAKSDAMACYHILMKYKDKINLEKFAEADFYDLDYQA